jgi:CheY-like chemotaxis protein
MAPSKQTGHASTAVAIINTSPDTVDMLKDVLEHAGFLVVAGYTHAIRTGEMNLEAFLHTHDPAVIVYDLAPPYERNWHLLQNLRKTLIGDLQIVLTSTNAQQAQKLAGTDEKIYEVIGKPYDLDEIVRAVKEAARARPIR